MANIIGSPSRYIQGQNEIENLCTYSETYGGNLLIITDNFAKKTVENIVFKNDNNTKITYCNFNGECSINEINRIIEICKNNNCDVIAGIGGGKVLDTTKAVSYQINKPVIIVPTIASTDAPCSSLSVIYKKSGEIEKYLYLKQSPNIVLVDTCVICKAPTRLLVAGMGDALSTYFEARACKDSDATNSFGGKISLSAMALAKLCYDTLLKKGALAKSDVEKNICTKNVEDIIETNIYLSGIGFESGGLAAAHAIHNALTVIPKTYKSLHGEKIAFCTLVQLVLENADILEIKEMVGFCSAVGLPTTLQQIGIDKIEEDELMEVCKLSCFEEYTMGNMPFEIKPKDVYKAIIKANDIGLSYK